MGCTFGAAGSEGVRAIHLLQRQSQPSLGRKGDEATGLTDARTDGSSLVLRDSRLADVKGGSKLCL